MADELELFEADVVFTEAAAHKVADLMADEEDVELKLRVFVTGGGCSGFQYGFSFAEELQEGDAVKVTDGVTLAIDPVSYSYLTGAEIDYKEDVSGAQFVIRNPNAQSTCGCGSSFTP